VIYCR